MTPSGSDRDDRLNAALAEYLEAADAGTPVQLEAWLSKYPDLKADLEVFLANQKQMEQLAAPLREAAQAADVTPTVNEGNLPRQTPAVGAHIRYFGDYELLEEIARGGMGVVFKARQVSLNRIVALKMILAGQLASPADVQRFRTEAEAAANLDHPNIVPIYEVGEHEGQHYFTMKYVDGGSLSQRGVRGEGLGTSVEGQRTAARLVEQVARAVHYAHQRGILHRDLKPANILLSFTRRSQNGAEWSPSALVVGKQLNEALPMVTDFGLAKRLITEPDATADQPLTATGAVLGTPSYMSPEQAAGQRDAITVASDVYSLGAILYELLTGRPPFQGANQLEVLRQVQETEPPRPTGINPRIELDLETVVLKSMAKEPARRYPNSEEMANDLRRYLNREPISARPIGRMERTWRWARRRPATAALLLVSGVAVLSLAGVIVGIVYNSKLEGLNSKLQTSLGAEAKAREGELEQKRQVEKARDAVDYVLYVRRVGLAEMEYAANRVDRANRILDECPPKHRHWEWRRLKRLCNSEFLSIRAHPEAVLAVAFSPDGRRIASAYFAERNQEVPVKLWDALSGALLLTIDPNGGPRCLAFSPDGKCIAAGGEFRGPDGATRADIVVWDSTTARQIFECANVGDVTSVAFSPNGKYLGSSAVKENETVVTLWDSSTGQKLRSFRKPNPVFGNEVDFSPDSRWIALADRTVHVWDVENGKEIFSPPGDTFESLCFSPDGSRLTAGGSTVTEWDVKTRQQLENEDRWVSKVVYGPGGQGKAVLARSTAEAGGPRGPRLFLWNMEGKGGQREWRGHWPMSLARSPDGRFLATGGTDGTVKVWDTQSAPDSRRVTPEVWEATIKEFLLDPHGKVDDLNGKFRISITETKNLEPSVMTVTDSTTGRVVLSLTLGDDIEGVAISPDGELLAASWRDHGEVHAAVWALSTGEKRFTLVSTMPITQFAFHPDSSRLAAGCFMPNEILGARSETKVWEMTLGEEMFAMHDIGLSGRLAWSRDGNRLGAFRPNKDAILILDGTPLGEKSTATKE